MRPNYPPHDGKVTDIRTENLANQVLNTFSIAEISGKVNRVENHNLFCPFGAEGCKTEHNYVFKIVSKEKTPTAISRQ